MTLNAPKGARREAPRPFGGVFGHQNGFKMSKKCPENVWGHFFDIFVDILPKPSWTPGHFFDIFWTFLIHAASYPQKGASGHLYDIFQGLWNLGT